MQNRHRYPRLKGFDYAQPRSYFVTFVVRDRRPVFGDQQAAQAVIKALQLFRSRDWYWLYGYCIMPDHVHLVLRPQSAERTLGIIIGQIKRAAIHYCHGVGIHFTWQDGYHDRIVRDYETTPKMVEYILLNPVRAGLVSDFNEYPFCGRPDSFC